VEHKPFRHSTMRSGSSSSSSRFKIRPKQVNASTCDFDRCCLQSGDNTGTHLHVSRKAEDRLTVIPDGVTDDQAASSLLKGLTARYLLKETVQLHEGDTVLYYAAAGGVGQIFTQWARSFGIDVIGTVSTAEKAQIALQAGCKAAVNYSTEDFVERTFELTGGLGVKAVYDSVGKASGAHSRY
jgi:NADPH:quinone reductase